MPLVARRSRPDRPPGGLRLRLQPTGAGLPSALAVCWFPLMVMAIFCVLVALDLNGSSTGQTYNWFTLGSDPGQILGHSRAVRSDEWFVQLSWTVSQYHQGFPPINPGLPGGTDLTALHDVPTAHWTLIFRPQLWGYFVLGLSHGLAWHWWLPLAFCAIAAYLLIITLNPRRPLVAAVLTAATVICPMTLWWWTSTVFTSAGWAFFVMAATIWVVRDPRLIVRLWWILTAGYFAVTLALTFYLPFILCAVWVCGPFAIGVAIDTVRGREIAPRVVLGRLGGLALAGIAAGATIGTYAVLHRDSLRAITRTIYPGQRSDPTGMLLGDGNGTMALFGAPFNGALREIQGQSVLGVNESASAAPFMVAAFLLPGLALLIVAARRSTGRWSWSAVAVLVSTGIYLTYLLVPHWDFAARLLLLDKIPADRSRLAFAMLLPVAAAKTIQLGDHLPLPSRRTAALLTALTVIAVNLAVWRGLRGDTPSLLAVDPQWRIAVVALCFGTVALFFRRLVVVGAAALMIATIVVSAGVVPLRQGVVDLHESAPGQAVRAADDDDPGTWVGTPFPVATAVLVQSGVKSLNGVQSYPSRALWSTIDPLSTREQNWNRFAHLDWVLGSTGTTEEKLVSLDHLVLTMDPCSGFAQTEVDYVLKPAADGFTSPCLESVQLVDTPAIDLEIMRVVPQRP